MIDINYNPSYTCNEYLVKANWSAECLFYGDQAAEAYLWPCQTSIMKLSF